MAHRKTERQNVETAPRPGSSPTPPPLLIYELLERILSFLPTADLLHSQRVCKLWKSVIDRSIPLQRALYFLPAPEPTAPANPFFIHAQVNPLLNKVFGDCMRFQPPESGVYSRDKTRIWLRRLLKPRTWQPCETRKEASWRRMLVTQPPLRGIQVVDLRVAPDYDDCFASRASDEEGVRMGQLLLLEEKGC